MSNYGGYGSNPYGSQQGGYGQQQGGYGQQQQGGYGQQPGGYGQQQQQHQGGYSSQQGGYGGQQGGYGGGGYGQHAGQGQQGGYGGEAQSVGYSAPSQGPNVLSNPDFLARVDAVRKDVDTLSGNISGIASAHQRAISSTDSSGSAALENLVSNTQVLNTRIRDQIKSLELDAARSGGNSTKDSQIRNLKNQFKSRLEQYQQEEVQYKRRYQDQIARQYRIVNPQASEEEVREAMDADWGDEGVFQTALRSNRVGAATSALGAVRARHNDIQKIEKTLIELNQLFQDMAEAVVVQDAMVQQAEQQTENVKTDTEAANVHLNKGVKSARNARKLKWVCCGIVTVVIIALGLGLGIYFGLVAPKNNNPKRKRNLEITY